MTESVQIYELKCEAERWKYIASYLASCHAATLEGLPKSAPKSTRRRHVKICENAAAYLRGTDTPQVLGAGSTRDSIEWNIKRCENAVIKHANHA